MADPDDKPSDESGWKRPEGGRDVPDWGATGSSAAGPGWETQSGPGYGPGWGTTPSYESNPNVQPGPSFGDPQGYGQPAYGAGPEPGRREPPPPVPPGYPPSPSGPWMPDPQAPYGRHPVTGEPYSDKSKLVAGLLQIFVGSFGTGRWYLGDYGIAVAQLLTCGGLGIWALIDGILILTDNVRDPDGRPLRD